MPIPGVNGSIVKTVAYVMQKDGSRRGYMILDMDFSSKVQALGCSATQPGVHCYHSLASDISGSNVAVTTEDQLTLKITYKNSSVPADVGLVTMAMELHWKYEQKDVKGAWTAGNQTGHMHKPATTITLTSFQSDLISHRHGWPVETAGNLCQGSGTCFRTRSVSVYRQRVTISFPSVVHNFELLAFSWDLFTFYSEWWTHRDFCSVLCRKLSSYQIH